MDRHAIEYYSTYTDPGPQGHFHEVIPLHGSNLKWPKVLKIVPRMCRGWYELSQLSKEDRIEFTRDFWLAKLPYQEKLSEAVNKFFANLDDIGIYLTQQKYQDLFSVQLVYSVSDNGGFFHGEMPADDAAIEELENAFREQILPADYLAFLRIHNGFAKFTDTGILPSFRIPDTYAAFHHMLEDGIEPIMTVDGANVNPNSLIPFYESFGMPFFQCFWKDWYPIQEMGNVYYSALTRTISICRHKNESVDTMAFQTFTDWLMFYLESVD